MNKSLVLCADFRLDAPDTRSSESRGVASDGTSAGTLATPRLSGGPPHSSPHSFAVATAQRRAEAAPDPRGAVAKTIEIWCPGKLTNPKNVQGLGLWKHRRLIRDARERACTAMLHARNTARAWPWPADTPKRVTFTAQLARLLDDDSLPYALSPIRDALGDAGLIGKTAGTVKGPGRVKDGPEDGHVFFYTQEVNREAIGVRIRIEAIA